MPIGRTTIIINCQHLIEKSLVRKTRFLDFHRGKLATRISEILLYSNIFSRSGEGILPYFGGKFDYEKLVAVVRGMCVGVGGGRLELQGRKATL